MAVEAVGKSLFPELLHVQGISELGSGLGVLCRTVGVDHRDVVLLGHQALGDALAHPAGAQDDDVHDVDDDG